MSGVYQKQRLFHSQTSTAAGCLNGVCGSATLSVMRFRFIRRASGFLQDKRKPLEALPAVPVRFSIVSS